MLLVLVSLILVLVLKMSPNKNKNNGRSHLEHLEEALITSEDVEMDGVPR